MVSIDGTTVDVDDTPANAEVFGRAGTGRGDGSAFPQLRIVALGECGTHAVIAAVMDSYSVVEQTLAKRLVPALGPGMLCLADGGFTAHPLMTAAAAAEHPASTASRTRCSRSILCASRGGRVAT